MWSVCSGGGRVCAGAGGLVEVVQVLGEGAGARVRLEADDMVADVALASSGARLAVLTGASKRLLVWELGAACAGGALSGPEVLRLPRAASRLRWAPGDTRLLVADKTGDALLYSLAEGGPGGRSEPVKLCGHLSLLLDALMTPDERFVLTCDRDEKIRVSHYPNTYNVKAYCLGHREFVKRIELLPSDERYLVSASGDGTIKLWEFAEGRLCRTIEATKGVDNAALLESFRKLMDTEGVEVESLPIVHMSTVQFDSESSLIAVTIHSCDKILIYRVTLKDQQFTHAVYHILPLKKFPSGIQFVDDKLTVCLDGEDPVMDVYHLDRSNGDIAPQLCNSIKLFSGENMEKAESEDSTIKVLYKRKFDNVQEYQERKRQRLEKNGDS